MRRAALALAAALAIAVAACSHDGASPWTPAADPPAVSDSTLSVLVTSAGAMVWKRFDPVSGESRRFLSVPGDPSMSEIVWSPDGRLAVVSAAAKSDADALFEVDLVSGATRELPPSAPDGNFFTQLFFRDGVLYGWTTTTTAPSLYVDPSRRHAETPARPDAWQLTRDGWRRCVSTIPDDALIARFDDAGLHYSALDVEPDERPTGASVPISLTTDSLRHHRGRFVLVSADDPPHELLEDDQGHVLWKTPGDGWAVWWPTPIAPPPTVTSTPNRSHTKYYDIEPGEVGGRTL